MMRDSLILWAIIALGSKSVIAKARKSYCASSESAHNDYTCKFPFIYEVLDTNFRQKVLNKYI